MSEARPLLAHHFESYEQQTESASLGMWLFLVTEIMFFGGLFTVYTIYRWRFPGAFRAGSHELDILLGGVNTAVLLTSSFTMALAVRAAKLSLTATPPKEKSLDGNVVRVSNTRT